MFTRYKRILTDDSDGESNFWPSFTDIMTNILLFFLLALCVVILIRKGEMEEAISKINESQQQAQQSKQELDRIIGIKSSIIKDLSSAFEKSDLDMSIDSTTGAICFSGAILFESGKSNIQPQFKESLSAFFPKYIEVILGPKYKEHISEIIVEGHTDDQDEYMYNLRLSQDRALSVVTYLLDRQNIQFGHRDELKRYITANGKSFSYPILDKEGKVDREKSRRVEFKFRLKDEEMINKLTEILSRME